MIASFVPGRVRLRFEELKNPTAAEGVKERITQTSGVKTVSVNPTTGSILIEYDPAIIPDEKLAETGKEELAKLGIELDMSVLQKEKGL